MARRCSCECTKTGARGCVNGVVGRQDPKKTICDVCYYEITTVSHIRRQVVCRYPAKLPSTMDRIIGR
ncbi:hypothetical protein PG994_005225 [Apiospora phragmitis]|uniref:Uncharacterized protein n=1 Tax=Apiospora phragmitis TaxID=2905665 RepID=A0ABR1VSS6_9PEZI